VWIAPSARTISVSSPRIQAARTVIAVAADRRDDIREAEARSGKPCAIGHHGKALASTQHVDISNTGQRAQGRAQRPVQQVGRGARST
jgi:hypothetical protein